MIFDGITLVEGSEISNLVVASGPAFPTGPLNPPDEGELFYKTTATEGLYIYKNGGWIRFIGDNETLADSLPDQPGLSAGDYRKVTVTVKGLVTAGENPTTLAGYGITDAQPLDADLTAIANLAGISGVLRKTGINTWVLDTGTYLTANQLITLSGDVSGSGTTAITATLTNTGVAAGTYGAASQSASIGVDSKGRITSASQTPIQIDASAITSGSIAAARISEASVTQHQAALSIAESQITDGTLLARLAGNESISGTWSFANPVSVGTPTANGHAATKSYVDSIAAGVNPHASVRVATTGPITLSGTQTIDGVSILAGDRVLVKDQSSQEQNGAYVASSSAWSRATDFDGSPTNEVVAGDLLFVESGTVNANTSWVLVTTGTISIGTSPLVFSLFSKAGELDAGAGLSKTGNTLNIGTASASRIAVNADNIDLATTGVAASTYRSVTVDTYGRVTAGTNPTTLSGYGITDAAPLSHVGSGGAAHTEATTTVAGFMSAADKTKLDNAYHTGNLSFGSGLSYSGGVLTASGTAFNGGTITNSLTITSAAPQLILGNTSGNIVGRVSSTTGTGGFGLTLQLLGANATISGQVGGAVNVIGGSGNGAAEGGAVSVQAGNSGGSTSASTTIQAGNNTSSGIGGDLFLSSGNSTSGTGGAIILRTGAVSNTFIERFRILANGAWSVGSNGTSTGTTGQVLTSNGSGSAPTWQSAPFPGSISSQQLAFGGGSNTLSGSNNLTWNGTNIIFGNGMGIRGADNTASGGTSPTISITGGSGTSTSHPAGGSITLTGGQGLNDNSIPGKGGDITIIAGRGGNTATGSPVSGILTLSGAPGADSTSSGSGSGFAGGIAFISGGTGGLNGATGGTAGSGGNTLIRGGLGGSPRGGSGGTAGSGGAIGFETANSTSLSRRMTINPDGSLAFGTSTSNVGSTGQVLISNGSSGPPSWSDTLPSLSVTGYIRKSVGTGITAAGTTQGTATVLNRELSVVSTVAAGTGVILPSSVGTTFVVVNAGANALNVYPVSGAAIDASATNAATILPVGARIMFIQVSATQYYTLNATYA